MGRHDFSNPQLILVVWQSSKGVIFRGSHLSGGSVHFSGHCWQQPWVFVGAGQAEGQQLIGPVDVVYALAKLRVVAIESSFRICFC